MSASKLKLRNEQARASTPVLAIWKNEMGQSWMMNANSEVLGGSMEEIRWVHVQQSCKPVGDHSIYGTLFRDQLGNLGWHLVEWAKQAKPVWEYWFSKDEFYEIVRHDDDWVGHGHFEIGRRLEVDPLKAEAIREIVREFEKESA